jgi:hypothetical protein
MRTLLDPARVVVSVCGSCGRQYSPATWKALHLVGEQSDGEGGVLELRNCLCGSTISPLEEPRRSPSLRPLARTRPASAPPPPATGACMPWGVYRLAGGAS